MVGWADKPRGEERGGLRVHQPILSAIMRPMGMALVAAGDGALQT
jgi:hypothetical protein